MTNKKKIIFMYLGVVCYFLYALVVTFYVATQSALALTIWEVYTIISSIFILLMFLTILSDIKSDKSIWKTAAIVCMSCTTALTMRNSFCNANSNKTVS